MQTSWMIPYSKETFLGVLQAGVSKQVLSNAEGVRKNINSTPKVLLLFFGVIEMFRREGSEQTGKDINTLKNILQDKLSRLIALGKDNIEIQGAVLNLSEGLVNYKKQALSADSSIKALLRLYVDAELIRTKNSSPIISTERAGGVSYLWALIRSEVSMLETIEKNLALKPNYAGLIDRLLAYLREGEDSKDNYDNITLRDFEKELIRISEFERSITPPGQSKDGLLSPPLSAGGPSSRPGGRR